jgi:predicted metalloprotease
VVERDEEEIPYKVTSFTHGFSAMHQQWLTTGLKSGQVDCRNTFACQTEALGKEQSGTTGAR